MNNQTTTRSKELLEKVYNHLDTIDISKLSMNELKDFLKVVQKVQFLESYGQISSYGFGMCAAPFTRTRTTADTAANAEITPTPDAK